MPDDLIHKITTLINIDRGQEMSTSYYYGFRQLMEISIRALSPGINDPETVVLGLHALGELIAFRLRHFPQTVFTDSNNSERIWVKEKTIEDIFEEYINAIWDYGKEDRLVQKEMSLVLTQLNAISPQAVVSKFLLQVQKPAEQP